MQICFSTSGVVLPEPLPRGEVSPFPRGDLPSPLPLPFLASLSGLGERGVPSPPPFPPRPPPEPEVPVVGLPLALGSVPCLAGAVGLGSSGIVFWMCAFMFLCRRLSSIFFQ